MDSVLDCVRRSCVRLNNKRVWCYQCVDDGREVREGKKIGRGRGEGVCACVYKSLRSVSKEKVREIDREAESDRERHTQMVLVTGSVQE